ncbi:MAG: type III-B CRISPR module-associated protein Cmr5 [Candidatus Competibacter sp.]|nr:type III-B CRISPR module-associated protein Cmr5 [Candidatus Competibacter sp.]MDG4584925.1 type III-B CRISPR module-associated protein Cmr5 [Candidatus Competibacter sp.]
MADYTPKATITLKSKAPLPTTSLDQQRAAYAWKCVQNVPKDYDKLAKAAPALIMNNGLMQALAFYQDKGKTKEGVMDRYHALNAHLMRWLGQQFGGNSFPSAQNASFDTVMPALYDARPELFRRATEETLALLRWIRQFAAAVTPE